MAIWAMVKKQNYKRLLKTPLDWLMLTYFIWTLICGFDPRHTFSGIQSVVLFYFVGVCALDTIPRLKKFLNWWCFFIFVIAALAVLSLYGFDPLGTQDIVQGTMKGRLMLNLSVFDNPNALAHSVVPAIPLFYYMVYWRQIITKAWILLLAVPLYCIYLTQSKGAFLCGFATILATLTFGRSKIWQVVIVIVSMTFGYAALYALPRMNELQNSKTDPAIQGRIAAFTYGLQLMRTNWFGIGLGNFETSFQHHGPLEKKVVVRIIPARVVPAGNGHTHEIDEQRKRISFWIHYSKATHCAYNQNGAELGYVGLFLFVGILYCCIRTLVLMKCEDDDEERIRRALFALVVAYAVSSWMVDFCYRPTFFMFVAAVSAFHRHLLRKQSPGPEPLEAAASLPSRPWLRDLQPLRMPGIPLPGLAAPATAAGTLFATPQIGAPSPALQPAPVGGGRSQPRALARRKHDSSLGSVLRDKFIWDRLGLLDFLITLCLTFAAIRYWEHLIKTM